MSSNKAITTLLTRLRALREEAGLTTEQMDALLNLGPGWAHQFETGRTIPTIDVLLAMLRTLKVKPSDFFMGMELAHENICERQLWAESDGNDLVLHFRYNDYDAIYRLEKATLKEYTKVVKVLQGGLARVGSKTSTGERFILTDSVVRTFFAALKTWPHANPSDLWWFLIYRAYCDPFNHPASNAYRDFGQSWKRTGGWALEEVLVRHYGPYLNP